ncbi:MAG: ABC transporter permease, partial [Tannerellaceae bacterium]|nr:ABC transporter permease [Tannerellaceae bacterium]
MKTLFRNFTSIFRKYTVPMSLNILGLAVAFAVFLIIMMQLDFDRNFDSCHLNADRIFRLELNQIGEGWSNTNCRPFGELLIASSPHITAGAIADEIDLGSGSTDLTFDAPTGKISIHEQIIDVTPGYADIFTFNMIEGTAKALAEPDNILIPQSMARKFFGNDNAVGMKLRSLRGDFSVGGVYADFPRNSSTGNHVYAPFPKDKHVDNWSLWNYSCY